MKATPNWKVARSRPARASTQQPNYINLFSIFKFTAAYWRFSEGVLWLTIGHIIQLTN
jgi:hypothetical protein